MMLYLDMSSLGYALDSYNLRDTVPMDITKWGLLLDHVFEAYESVHAQPTCGVPDQDVLYEMDNDIYRDFILPFHPTDYAQALWKIIMLKTVEIVNQYIPPMYRNRRPTTMNLTPNNQFRLIWAS